MHVARGRRAAELCSVSEEGPIAKAERYWDKHGRGHDGPWDAIVIGSGMGGMTAAALLAKLGKRVLVLEQHYVPGGFTHTFARKRWTWDVGVHAVGEVSGRGMPARVLDRLTDGRLKWASLGDPYDVFSFPDGFQIDFPGDRHRLRANLVEAFPGEEAAIDGYLGLCRDIGRAMRGYYLARIAPRRLSRPADRIMGREARKWLRRTAADVLAELTDNPKLRTVLAAQWGYHGAVPSRASFAMQALVTRHFFYGAWYPVGGSGRIAVELLRTVAEAGGWTRIYADVEQILIEKGRAVGVRMKDGSDHRAPRIISAAGVMSTLRHLLPAEARGGWTDEVLALKPAPAHVCLYLGFEGDIRTAGAGPANQWFWNTWSTEAQGWDIRADPLPDAPVLYCSFPSLKDPEHDAGPDELHTGEVVTFVPWEAFAAFRDTTWKRRGPEYDALKQRLHDALLEQFLQRMPELRPMLKYSELSTPLSTAHFVRPMAGSIYGIEPTPERFRNRYLRPRSPIKGLYFGGSEVSGVGVVGAMMGGLLAGAAADPLRGLRWIQAT